MARNPIASAGPVAELHEYGSFQDTPPSPAGHAHRRLWTVLAAVSAVAVVSLAAAQLAGVKPAAAVDPDVSVKGVNWTPYSQIDVGGRMVDEVFLPATADEWQLCSQGFSALHFAFGPSSGDGLGPRVTDWTYDNFAFGYSCAEKPEEEVWDADLPYEVYKEHNMTYTVSCAEFDPELDGNENSTVQYQRLFGVQMERYEITASQIMPNATWMANASNETQQDRVRSWQMRSLHIRDSLRMRAICDFDPKTLDPSAFSAWKGRREGTLKQEAGVYCEPDLERHRLKYNNAQKLHLQVFHDRGDNSETVRFQFKCGNRRSDPAAPPTVLPRPTAPLAEKYTVRAESDPTYQTELDRSIGYIQSHPDPEADGRRGIFSHFVTRR